MTKFIPELTTIQRELIEGENIEVMKSLLGNGFSGAFQMIYMDGPFNSGLVFSLVNKLGIEYVNPWSQYETIYHYFEPQMYLEHYRQRLKLAKELLANSGILVLQTNQVFGHQIKAVLDDVFGRENMLPEVIWKHSSTPWEVLPGYPVGYQHENLFFYSKSEAIIANFDVTELYPSIWDDISGYQYNEEENTGYPSQKPERLIERILEITTQENDLVGDFYCGSGTFAAVAEKMGRRWIACDQSSEAITITRQRLSRVTNQIRSYITIDDYQSAGYRDLTYTKQTRTPLSKIELSKLPKLEQPQHIRAYSFFPDVDLLNEHEQFRFYYMFPKISAEGISKTKLAYVARPIPKIEREEVQLIVPQPVEWVLHHLVCVEKNQLGMMNVSRTETDYLSIFRWEETLAKAQALVALIDGQWIADVQKNKQFIEITDIFGYIYMLERS